MSEHQIRLARKSTKVPRLEVFIFDEDLAGRWLIVRLILSNGDIHVHAYTIPDGMMDTGEFAIIQAQICESIIREVLDPGGVQLALF